MSAIFNLPDLGEGLPNAEIHEWFIKVGDVVKVDQVFVSVETAKALVEIPSPQAGKIIKLYGQPGDTIQTHSPLIQFEAIKNQGTVVGKLKTEETLDIAEFLSKPAKNISHKIPKATPFIRNLAKTLNIDLNQIQPSRSDQVITQTDIQRTMALKMTEAHQTVVPVTVCEDAELPENYSDLTLKLIAAIISACQKEPNLNTQKNINIGLAIDTPKGLFVPVIKQAEKKSPQELREIINTFKQKSIKQNFSQEDLKNPTITLSNFGTIAGRYATPIVVPPTVAILATGKIRDQVMIKNKQINICPVMPLSLTFDHRFVTGGEACRFLKQICDILNNKRLH